MVAEPSALDFDPTRPCTGDDGRGNIIKTMKLERVALAVAVLALISVGWSALEVRKLQVRLNRITIELPLQQLPNGSGGSPSTNLEERLKKLEAAAPSPGLFMSAVQLHFAKLYFAGEARNWDLARFERGEILEHLEVVAALRPEEGAVSVAGIMDAFKNTQLVALKDAIEVKDRGLFRDAYRESMLMCNACHQATGRPFINIIIPTNPPVSNQRWDATVSGGK